MRSMQTLHSNSQYLSISVLRLEFQNDSFLFRKLVFSRHRLFGAECWLFDYELAYSAHKFIGINDVVVRGNAKSDQSHFLLIVRVNCWTVNTEHIVLITQNRIWIVLTLGEQSEQSEWLYRKRKCVLWSSLLLLVRTEEIRKTLIFVVYGLSKWIAYFIQFFSFVRFNDKICLFGLQ